MNTYEKGIIGKADLASDIVNGIINVENLKIVNEHVWETDLTTIISNFFKVLPHNADDKYVEDIADVVNNIVGINKEFYINYWKYQILSNTSECKKEILEKTYSCGNQLVSKSDWEECLSMLIESHLIGLEIDMDKVIKYKDELKEFIKNK